MDTPKRTVTTQLGCDNCGRKSAYELPIRREIIDFDRAEDVESAYQRMNETDYHTLFCKFCKLPCLKVLWWGDEDPLIHAEVNNG